MHSLQWKPTLMSFIRFRGARATTVLVGAIALTLGCGPDPSHVSVERAAITLDVLAAPAAAYFTLVDGSSSEDSVVAIRADMAQSVSMQVPQSHRVPGSQGSSTMLMVPVASVPIGRSGSVRFAPGGNTAILLDLKGPLVIGDSVRLTVILASGRSAITTAPVVTFEMLEQVLGGVGTSAPRAEAPSLSDGTALYRSNGCASCHGPLGFGDGPVGVTLDPPPRDFRDTLAFKTGRDVAQIARMLAVGMPSGGNMPLYPHLTNQERASLALHVISLRASSRPGSNTP